MREYNSLRSSKLYLRRMLAWQEVRFYHATSRLLLTTKRSLAYMEMRLVLATVLLRYNVQLQSPTLETTEGFMHKPLKMMVKFSRR